ncbi:hypothetical protein ACFLXQ_02000 [Chloroflexota bacterium]
MNDLQDRIPLRDTLLQKLTIYGQRVGELGRRVRQLVFGFRLRSTVPIDRWSLPVKLTYDHRLVQRKRTFQQGGGHRSSMARYALNKVRRKKQQV